MNRTTVLAIVLGLVLLGAVAAYSIFLPKAEGSSESSATTSTPRALPDSLPHGLKATDLSAPQAGQTVSEKALETSAAQEATKLYGAPAQVRIYQGASSSVGAQIVSVAATPGVFGADVVVPDPSLVGEARGEQVAQSVDGAVCISYYQQALPKGTPLTSGGLPALTRCQLDGGSDTWTINASGLAVTDVVDVLHAAAGR